MNIKWSVWDRVIAKIRYSKVQRYLSRNCVLCDLGCGFEGTFLQSQSGNITRGYGFDRKVTSKNYGHIHLSNLENLENGIPIESNEIDTITMLALLEHLDKPEKVLSEAYRILKKNGCLILTTPSISAKPILEFLAFKLKIISSEEIKDHKHYFSRKELVSCLQKASFRKIHYSTFLFGLNQIIVGEK